MISIIVRLFQIKISYLVNKFTFDDTNKFLKENILFGNKRQNNKPQNNTFLNNRKEIKDNNIFARNNKKYKTNSFIGRTKYNFNTSCNNTNREIINLFEENNNRDKKNNNNMNEKEKDNNLFYENKISKLETEINELKNDKEKMRENLYLFLTLIRKYSHKLSSLTKNFSNNPSSFQEIKSILFNLNKTINNPKLNEDILDICENGILDNKWNFNNKNTLNDDDISLETDKENISERLEEYKNSVEEIISKYEKKIDILKRESEDLQNKINILENENNSLKGQLDEEKRLKENILNELNKLKEENMDLEKRNKILDYKCTSYFNRSTQSKYEQKNIEEEIEYKNRIIKYLENLLKNTGFKRNEEIYKRNIHKVIDLKKNLKEVINKKVVFNDDINKQRELLLLSNEKSKCIENGSSYINEKSISSNSFKSNNNRQVKKEIDLLDEEIEQIQSKLEYMIKNE